MTVDGSTQQSFRAGSFEGPLDLLLFLIRKSEINIYDIPIAQITQQYLEYLAYVIRVDLENITEFYRVATTLLYIKSRMLLPVEFNVEDELEDPRKDLVDRLIEHQKYKKLSEAMAEQEIQAEWVVERGKNERVLPFGDDAIWEQISVWDLLQTFSQVISAISYERVIDLYEEVSVNEKITLISELLESAGDFRFADLITKDGSVAEIVCAFIAILEMVKSKTTLVLQNKLFGDIMIRTKKANEEE